MSPRRGGTSIGSPGRVVVVGASVVVVVVVAGAVVVGACVVLVGGVVVVGAVVAGAVVDAAAREVVVAAVVSVDSVSPHAAATRTRAANATTRQPGRVRKAFITPAPLRVLSIERWRHRVRFRPGHYSRSAGSLLK
jgi:hypothetical protein